MPHLFAFRKKELERLPGNIQAAVYQPVGNLSVTAWVTPEPVSYAKRTTGRKLSLSAGEKPGQLVENSWSRTEAKPVSGAKWGELFECAWFHFEGKVPAPAAGAQVVLLIDVSGEVLVVDDKGQPLQGLTNKGSEFDYSLGRPGKYVVPVAKRAKGGEKVSVWADAGANDLFGFLKEGSATLKQAQIAILHLNLHQLSYDVEVLEDLLRQLPTDSARYQQILRGLCRVADMLADMTDENAKQAREVLKPLLAQQGGDPSLTISAIGHSHMDLAWLWPIRETFRKCARTFSTVMRMMERYPDYIFGASQPQQYEWTKNRYPSLYCQIVRRIKEGRWDIQGGMWVEADTNITSGESLVRQFLFGQRFWQQEFGRKVNNLWLPDVFGYSGALPQIIAKCGCRFFMTQKLSWNEINSFPHQSFWWQGIDGTKILAHMLPEETYNAPAAPRGIAKAERNYKDVAVSSHAMMLFGIGDGGGGPGEEHLERLAREKNLSGLCPVVQEKAEDFFAKWERQSGDFVTWRGELYLEKHQGTLTSQARNKRFNRKMELALRDAEMLGVLAQVAGAKYPQEQLNTIWKEVLLYQFHDILPGSSITRVYAESLARYEVLLAETLKLAAQAEQAVLAKVDTTSAKRPVVLCNSLSWQRNEWLNLSGKWFDVQVPACGFAVIDESVPSPVETPVQASTDALENALLKVTFARDGSIESILDKETGREMLEGPGNRLAMWHDSGDAWDMSLDYRATPPAGYMKLVSAKAFTDGPVGGIRQEYEFGAARLSQEIRMTAGTRRVDFVTHADFSQETRKLMLRTSFATTIKTDEARCEIQYGSLTRPTHVNTSWDVARQEINAHKWVDMSEPNAGFALLNDCKYGYRVRGGEIDLNLLRRTFWPDPQGDKAEHDFTYSIFPHAGSHIEGGVVRAGYELNVPLRATRAKPHAGQWGATRSFVQVDSPNVVVEAIKKAEDGDEMIVRLYECHGQTSRCKVKFDLPVRSAAIVNMLEEEPQAVRCAGGSVMLDFGPYEIHTLRITR